MTICFYLCQTGLQRWGNPSLTARPLSGPSLEPRRTEILVMLMIEPRPGAKDGTAARHAQRSERSDQSFVVDLLQLLAFVHIAGVVDHYIQSAESGRNSFHDPASCTSSSEVAL